MFINEVVEKITKVFNEGVGGYNVSVNHIMKNNGIQLDGLLIHKEGQKIAPNIYLNGYYTKYRNGASMDSIINDILELYYNSSECEFVGQFDLDFEYENIKDSIVYKVINFKQNIEMLKTIPYIKILDLAIIFQCNVNTSDEALASIRINNRHCKSWGITTSELLCIAASNTPRLFPCVIRRIEDVMKDLITKGGLDLLEGMSDFNISNMVMDDDSYYYTDSNVDADVLDEMINRVSLSNAFDMYVFTNAYGINGASVMMYNGVLERFAKRLDKDLIVIPSSIHEIIVIPKCKDWDADGLRDMVREINSTQVPIEDILSNSIYTYSRKQNALLLV